MFKGLVALLLAIIHGAAGLGILMLSSWFIAASSIAGLSFNYMLPAVIIRALALIRISSGYAHLWLGHHHLLGLTSKIRITLFGKLENAHIKERAIGIDALANYSEDIASIWVSWISHQASALVICVISFMLLLFNAQDFSAYLGYLILAWLILNNFFCALALLIAKRQIVYEKTFRFESEHFFKSSNLWHLYQSHQDATKNKNAKSVKPSGQNVWQLQLIQQLLGMTAVWLLQGFSFSLVIILCLNAQIGLGIASTLIVPMMLISSQDWLGRSLQTHGALARHNSAKQAVEQIDFTHIEVIENTQPLKEFELKDFSVKTEILNPKSINLKLNQSGLVLIKGNSGSGKSQLLKAIAGHNIFIGERKKNNTTLKQGLMTSWIYIEQTPAILNATVKGNLNLAGNKIKEQDIHITLNKVGLTQLNNLNEWLGVGGRELSGGERKRFALAQAILAQPDIYLIDEPFEGLDHAAQLHMAELIQHLSETKIVFVASHIMLESLQADCIFDLDD